MFYKSDGPWGLGRISHMQNLPKSTSGFPGAKKEVSGGHPGESVFAWANETMGERDWGQEPLSEEVGISKSSRKYPRDEVRFNICQIEGRSHWLSKNCWMLCPLPYLHMCMKEGSVALKWHPVSTGGGECRWAGRAEAISIIPWRQAEEAGERWVKKPHRYQSEGFDQHLGLSRLTSDIETVFMA